MSNYVFLGLGTNLGDREAYLNKSLELIRKSIGPIESVSDIYETEPWGFHCENNFLNMVVRINTNFKPADLLKKILTIEGHMGRIRDNTQYISRTIDIDILLYRNLVINKPGLIIPHPIMQDRKFVLVPLCDLAAEVIHPIINKTFSALLRECQDESKVIRYQQSCNILFRK
jgi:2-amino-4-hydroxy-6-hydroxymethyldihydropteridine diphosphokinase